MYPQKLISQFLNQQEHEPTNDMNMTKEEFCKYDSYISELVEKSNHT